MSDGGSSSVVALEELRSAGVKAVREACIITELVRQTCDLKGNNSHNNDEDDDEKKKKMVVVKDDQSPATIADFAAQAILIMLLKAQFPNIPFVAEENASELKKKDQDGLLEQITQLVRQVPTLDTVSQQDVLESIDSGDYDPSNRQEEDESKSMFWCIDPIDGTKGYLRNDQYAVCLGLIQYQKSTGTAKTSISGVPVLGVLGCPCLPEEFHLEDPPPSQNDHGTSPSSSTRGTILHACTGGGVATMSCLKKDTDHNTYRQIASRNSMGDIIIHRKSPAVNRFVESVETGSTNHSFSAKVAANINCFQSKEPLRLDSQAKYAAVARGDAAVYLRLANYQHCIWDHAAGACIVREAGGHVTDALGNTLDFAAGRTLSRNSGGIVATSGCAANPNLHKTIIATIAKLRFV